MEKITNIAIGILALLIVYAFLRASQYVVKFMKSKMSADDAEKLDKLIEALTEAAEQLYKKEDPDGTIRFDYVAEQLVQAGYDITEAVRALIESKVYRINQGGKA